MKKILSIFVFAFWFMSIHAQVGIINETPDASAAMQITSPANDKGVLIPRLTEDQVNAIASPAIGLLVFDFNNNVFKFFNGSDWNQIGTTSQTNNLTLITIKDGGDIYFNTSTFNMNYFNGSGWRKFKKTGTSL